MTVLARAAGAIKAKTAPARIFILSKPLLFIFTHSSALIPDAFSVGL